MVWGVMHARPAQRWEKLRSFHKQVLQDRFMGPWSSYVGFCSRNACWCGILEPESSSKDYMSSWHGALGRTCILRRLYSRLLQPADSPRATSTKVRKIFRGWSGKHLRTRADASLQRWTRSLRSNGPWSRGNPTTHTSA